MKSPTSRHHSHTHLHSSLFAVRSWRLIAVAAAVGGAILGGSSSAHIDTLWDELVDHDIAVGLQGDPLFGEQPTLDATQMRLPMYLNAAAFAITGRSDLALSRLVSLVCGAVTVLATAALARLLFGPLVAMLAAILLAFSPYFLSFARIGMTEGDVCVACFVVLAIWAFVRYLGRPSAGRWVLSGILLALAVGAKLFAGFLIPVFAVLAWTTRTDAAVPPASPDRDANHLRRLLTAQVGVLVVTGMLALLHRRPPGSDFFHPFVDFVKAISIVGWLMLFVLWAGTLFFVLRRRVMATGRWARLCGLVVFAGCTFFTLMPVHLLEHSIFREVVARTLRWDNRLPLALWSDHLRLYSGILLIKLTWPIGVLTVVALLYAAFREREEGRWRPVVLSFVFYVALLCFLPLRQTFYLMGIDPLIVIASAAFVVEIGRRLGRIGPWAVSVWTIAVLGMLGHLGIRVFRGFPNYHLYGVDIAGNRWLGADSLGYRNLIQTPSDGVESLIRWCNTDPSVRPGDRVVSYLWEERIIEGLLPPDRHYVFIGRGISPFSDEAPPPPSIDGADFVLLHVNNLLGYGDRPPDRPSEPVLSSLFEPVFTVRRGPLEVAWVYGRRR